MGNRISSTFRKIKSNISKPRFMKNSTRRFEEEIEAKNEDCPICLCEVEDEKPLFCGHKVHTFCLEQQIDHGAQQMEKEHLSFNFICCPLCRVQLSSPSLKVKLDPYVKLKEEVDKLAYESIIKMAEDVLKDVQNPKKYVKKLQKPERIQLGYRKLLFYKCDDCHQPYCGGAYSCLEAAIEAHANNNPGEGHNEIEEIELKDEEKKENVDQNEMNVQSMDENNELIKKKEDDEDKEHICDVNNILIDFKSREEDIKILTYDDDEDNSYDVSYFDDIDDDDDDDDEEVLKQDLIVKVDEIVSIVIPIPPPRPIAKHEIPQNPHQDDKKEENVINDEEKKESKKLCMDCIRRATQTGDCKHGFDELQYKCIKCCAPATYYCLGTEFYCDRCHSDLSTLYPCPGPHKCPLGFPHPPNTIGTHGGGGRVVPFAISCSICGPIARSFDNSILSNFSVRYG